MTHDKSTIPALEPVNGQTPDLFMRCGISLCGSGPEWKEQFGRMLRVKTDTIDAWSKGRSRIPPNIWREISLNFEVRERTFPILRTAAIDAAGGPLPTRTYEFPGGFKMPVAAKEDGTFPQIEYTTGTNGDWRLGWWAVLPDDELVLPERSLAYRFRWPGQAEPSAPFLVTRGKTAREPA